MKEANPVNPDEKEREKSIAPRRVDPAKEMETDEVSDELAQKIVRMVIEDRDAGILAYADWKKQREKDLQQINLEKPSVIEGLQKKAWQSDRNLGLLPATLDIYSATLLATCYNPDTIHFTATEQNDVDNRDNLEKFTKWAVSKKEMDIESEVDDFINNRIGQGFSLFKIEWEVKYVWVDERIPVWSKTKKPRVIRYDTKTVRRRFEKGRIKNVDNLDNIILPSYGKRIQELPFIIEIIPLYLSDIPDLAKRRMISRKFSEMNSQNKTLKTLPAIAATRDSLQQKKSQAEGIQQVVDEEGKNYPIDVLEWYGELELKGRKERYRVWVEPQTQTLVSLVPLRKVRRDGKYPYSGGPFRRQPGQLRGGSLTKLCSGIINAINNKYNQTSDYQTVNNLPFGFANFDEGFTESLYETDPGQIYSVDGNPSEAVYFPNLQRSFAWSYQDMQFLLDILERVTGAASYFLTSKTPDTTATRDSIVEQKGETKFGLWVRRIQEDIVEAINMAVTLYQDWAPPRLAKRVLGDDGKQIIRNLSIDTLRGNYDANMVPDMTAGSKAYEKQVMLWASQTLNRECVWLNPQLNPRGNWLLWKDTMMRQGIQNPEHYLPPQPKQGMDDDEEAKQEFNRMMQGEVIDPPEGVTPAVVRHLATHLKQKETMYGDLDAEYRENFDAHLFATKVNYDKFMTQVVRQQMEMQVASRAVQALETAGMGRGPSGMVPIPQGTPNSAPLGANETTPEPMGKGAGTESGEVTNDE